MGLTQAQMDEWAKQMNECGQIPSQMDAELAAARAEGVKNKHVVKAHDLVAQMGKELAELEAFRKTIPVDDAKPLPGGGKPGQGLPPGQAVGDVGGAPPEQVGTGDIPATSVRGEDAGYMNFFANMYPAQCLNIHWDLLAGTHDEVNAVITEGSLYNMNGAMAAAYTGFMKDPVLNYAESKGVDVTQYR